MSLFLNSVLSLPTSPGPSILFSFPVSSIPPFQFDSSCLLINIHKSPSSVKGLSEMNTRVQPRVLPSGPRLPFSQLPGVLAATARSRVSLWELPKGAAWPRVTLSLSRRPRAMTGWCWSVSRVLGICSEQAWQDRLTCRRLSRRNKFTLTDPGHRRHAMPCRATQGSTRLVRKQRRKGGNRGRCGQEPLLWFPWERPGQAE